MSLGLGRRGHVESTSKNPESKKWHFTPTLTERGKSTPTPVGLRLTPGLRGISQGVFPQSRNPDSPPVHLVDSPLRNTLGGSGFETRENRRDGGGEWRVSGVVTVLAP